MRARLRACLVVVLFLFAAIIAAVPPQQAKWASLGGDYRRTGQSRDSGPTAGCIQWQFETDGAIMGSTTVGSDGRVHVSCDDGKLYALDANGKALWVFDANTPLWSAASIGPDGGLYVGGENGTLYAVDPNGSLRWTYHTNDSVYSSAAVAGNGDVYVGSCDGTLYALASSGAPLWRFTTSGPGKLPAGSIVASPAIGADGTVYIGGLYDPNLYALNPSDGSVKWACSFKPASGEDGGWPFTSPVVGGDGTIYQTLLYDCRLYAIRPDTGTILWATDLLDLAALSVAPDDLDPDAAGWSEPVLGPDGVIYATLDDPYLRAVDPNGKILWASKLGDLGGFTLTVDKNNLVYAACDDGFVYVVDSSGRQVTQFELGGWPAFPVIAGEGLLIAADSRDYSAFEVGGKNKVWAISSRCGEGSQPVSK
jgi:outer membrane protein assembly factor BamB